MDIAAIPRAWLTLGRYCSKNHFGSTAFFGRLPNAGASLPRAARRHARSSTAVYRKSFPSENSRATLSVQRRGFSSSVALQEAWNVDQLPFIGGAKVEAVVHDDFQSHRLLKESFGSIVKIYCDSTDPNYAQPWQMRRQLKSIGSGFIISGRLVLTNAHCVSWQNRCLLRKHGSTVKYPGRVVAIGHECDLAILTVDDDSFWSGVKPLELGEVPSLHDAVTVVGYPTGGDNLCITSGVVSRVDVTTYAHSNFRLLCAQIDAAINAGNSGGPALKDGKVIGVAFQAYDEAQNIGYIIPTCIILQFLRHIDLHRRYTGFVTIGITYQLLENPALRAFVGLDSVRQSDLPENVTPSGILVCQCDKVVNDGDGLRTRDVIMAINGYDVADDGTVSFRDVERVHLAYALTTKFSGDPCELVVLRDGQVLTLTVRLQNPNYLVAEHQWEIMPRYYIFGGLVFVPLTMEYLKDEFGKKFYERAPSSLLRPLSDLFAKERGEEVVVLSQILASDLTVGYDFRNIRLERFNGEAVRNLRHLEELVSSVPETEQFVRFHFENEVVLVLDRERALSLHQQILDQHAIPSHRSRDL
ncbi:DegP protease, putative [Babesia bigemina]|uniref:DegP protease, putative n=1 Tax=Babesia bigemina TaxID=5866 RepID=A0A061DAJ9_BABBI|nr:DegP protease, putative [Babesia bigemina]CDR95924.1 DegP protease, putative [Babesia bigemina]|eukprot:XP_012768110.1 DegP protease, putative [Babesia bigemina]